MRFISEFMLLSPYKIKYKLKTTSSTDLVDKTTLKWVPSSLSQNIWTGQMRNRSDQQTPTTKTNDLELHFILE